MNMLWLGVVALLASGCLVKDTTETIYLEPHGAVTWSVLEKDVRSDEKRAQDRAREENAFSAAAAAERHPIAIAFARLNAADVRTVIVRDRRPFTVLTEARFPRLDTLMAAFAAQAGARATSALDRRDGLVTWTWTISEDDSVERGDDGKEMSALADSFEGCRFVLSAGHFISAVGFELSHDRNVATLRIPDATHGTGPADPLRFSLIWTEE